MMILIAYNVANRLEGKQKRDSMGESEWERSKAVNLVTDFLGVYLND